MLCKPCNKVLLQALSSGIKSWCLSIWSKPAQSLWTGGTLAVTSQCPYQAKDQSLSRTLQMRTYLTAISTRSPRFIISTSNSLTLTEMNQLVHHRPSIWWRNSESFRELSCSETKSLQSKTTQLLSWKTSMDCAAQLRWPIRSQRRPEMWLCWLYQTLKMLSVRLTGHASKRTIDPSLPKCTLICPTDRLRQARKESTIAPMVATACALAATETTVRTSV